MKTQMQQRCGRLVVLAGLCGLALAGNAAAGPVDGQGKKSGPDRPSTVETTVEREFRAGVQAQLSRDLDQAQTHFQLALKANPAYAPALLGLAGVAQARGDGPQAEAYLQRAERAAPRAAEVHLGWGRHFLSQRQPARAEKAFIQARSLAPQTLAPHLELGDLYLSAPGRTAQALASYRAALAVTDQSAAAYLGLGTALAQSGDRPGAMQALERAVALAPRDPTPLRSLGRLQLEAGDAAGAIGRFDQGLALQPRFVPLMVDRATALASLQRWPEAVSQLEAAEKLEPRVPEIHMLLGDVHQGAKQWTLAEARYKKVIELAPQHPAAYNNLAWMTVTRGGPAPQAVEWAKQAVALSPKSSPFHDTLGWALRAAGQLQPALTSLQQAITLEPKVAGYHLHLAAVQAELQQKDAAKASLRKALELQPQGPVADEARRQLAAL